MTLVPESRLLFWFAVVALPFSVLGALYPAAGPFAVLLIAGWLVLALADAAVSFGRLDGISVSLPEVVRLSKDREGSIDVTLKNEFKRPLRLRLGLALPWELASPHEDATVLLPAGAEQSRLDWPVTPLRRGNYRLRRAYLETASRLGFWVVRANVLAPCEARVYPNLLSERRTLPRCSSTGAPSASTRSDRSARAATSRSFANTSLATAMTRSTGKPPPSAGVR